MLMADVKVKICGLTQEREIDILAEYGAEYAGMVMFYPKSKRNIQEETAEKLIKRARLHAVSQTVAVTVSPDILQLKTIENLGFDYIQVHGDLSEEVYKAAEIPIIRAVNVGEQKSEKKLEDKLSQIFDMQKIAGILFDGSNPGEGKVFDWNILKNIKKNNKLLILAGGLNPSNIRNAIEHVNPDVVDVSSGVEYDTRREMEFAGKDKQKIEEFIRNAAPLRAAEWRK